MKYLSCTLLVLTVAVVVSGCADFQRDRSTLPLDHGPRAQTTPWENKQRLLRQEAKPRGPQAQQNNNDHP